MHAESQSSKTYGAAAGANMGPSIITKKANGAIPSQKMMIALMMVFMNASSQVKGCLRRNICVSLRICEIIHKFAAPKKVTPVQSKAISTSVAPLSVERIMTCSHFVNSDGGHNAGI